MIRVLVERRSDGGGLDLLGGESHHLRVRRVRDGEAVEVRDGAGLVGEGRLVRMGADWRVEVTTANLAAAPAGLTLAVGAGDRDRFAWVVEKATELGVGVVVPLETERTAAVGSRVRASHLDRLRRHALEAVKQSGAAWATEVGEPVSVAELAARPLGGLGWLADAEGMVAPARVEVGPLTIVVGPEGGLTEAERRSLRDAGYRPVSFGPHTLRFETAAVVAAAAAVTGRLRGAHG